MNSNKRDRVDRVGLLAIDIDKMTDVELHRAHVDSWRNEGEEESLHAIRINDFINGLRIAATSKVNSLGELGEKRIDAPELFDKNNVYLNMLFDFLVSGIDSKSKNNLIKDVLHKHIAKISRESIAHKDAESLIVAIEFGNAIIAKSLCY